MLTITMCAAGQKFPTHSLDACMQADQSEATTYYGYDTNITLSKPDRSFRPTDLITTLSVQATVHVCSQGVSFYYIEVFPGVQALYTSSTFPRGTSTT